MAGVGLLVSSYRVGVVVITLSVLLTLVVVLPTRVAGTALLFPLIVFVRSSFVLAVVSDHAFLPTAERLAVVAERSEVGVQNTAKVLDGVSTLSEGMSLRGNASSDLGFR